LKPVEAPPLLRIQRLVLRLVGRVGVGWLRGPGWSAWLPAVAFVCPRHGVVVDYEHGYEGCLVCPFCLEASG
jgi:hypothetical protein